MYAIIVIGEMRRGNEATMADYREMRLARGEQPAATIVRALVAETAEALRGLSGCPHSQTAPFPSSCGRQRICVYTPNDICWRIP